MVNCRLNYISLTWMIDAPQVRAYFDQCYRTLITQEQGVMRDVPSINKLVLGTLFDQLDERGADACGIHAREHLM
jgi:hypothetical protein